MPVDKPFRELVEYAIGGGWGQEEPFEDSLAVKVIRGTDFGNIASSNFSAVPLRYEERTKAERRLLRPNDIVLEISGGSRTSNQSTGRTLLITEGVLDRLGECAIPASFCRLVRVKEDVVFPRFAFYALQDMYRSGRAALYEHHSTGISNFQFEFFLDQESVWLPGISQQKAIAHILGTLDDRIDLNRRMSETIESMARMLFKDWFVDFGPVRAKAEGREPYLSQDIWDLFPKEFDDDGKPAGWGFVSFGSLLIGSIGGDWGKEVPDAEHTQPVCIIRGTDIPALQAGSKGKVPTRYVKPKKAEGRLLQDGDLVVEVSGGSPTQPTGRSILITKSLLERFPHPVICASFCRRFRPKSLRHGILVSQHLSHLYSVGGTWAYQNQSTGIANFQTTHFLETEKVAWPCDGIIDAFVRMVDAIARRTSGNENMSLEKLRDTLLPRLVSGKIGISEAEKQTGLAV